MPELCIAPSGHTIRALVEYATIASRSVGARVLMIVRSACLTISSRESPCDSLAPLSFFIVASAPIEPLTSTTQQMSAPGRLPPCGAVGGASVTTAQTSLIPSTDGPTTTWPTFTAMEADGVAAPA